MVFVKATKNSEAGTMPSKDMKEMLTKMGQFNEELVKAGILLAADGLKPSSAGARVRFSGSERTVIDGPFAETKELVAGYWILEVASLEEAVEWFKRCPNTTPDEEWEIEIRQFPTADDFGEALTPQQRELGARLEATAAEQHG